MTAFVEGAVRADARVTCSATRSMRQQRSGRWCAQALAEIVRGQIERGDRARARKASSTRRPSRRMPRARPISRRRCSPNVDHTMRVMIEESFGPVVGIMKVEIRRGGDLAHERQPLWPHGVDLDRGRRRRRSASASGSRPAPVYMNRCDYLDPGLAWTGVKDTGRGASLSRAGLRNAHAAEILPPAPWRYKRLTFPHAAGRASDSYRCLESPGVPPCP